MTFCFLRPALLAFALLSLTTTAFASDQTDYAKLFEPEATTLSGSPIVVDKTIRDINMAERKQLYKLLKWDQDCEDSFNDTQISQETDPNGYAMAKAYPLKNEKNKELLEIQCYLGAYQGEYIYIVHNKVQKTYHVPVKAVRVETAPNRYETRVGGLPNFNTANLTLDTVVKGRGLGDYGERYVWQLRPLENKLVLLEKRSRSYEESDRLIAQCDKKANKAQQEACYESLNADSWPIVYKAKGLKK
jgi:Protein of unknown function (DUF1176)